MKKYELDPDDFRDFHGLRNAEKDHSAKIVLSFRGNDLTLKSPDVNALEKVFNNYNYIKDQKHEFLRFLPMDFWDIVATLKNLGYNFRVSIETNFFFPGKLGANFTLRKYQQDALDAWLSARKRGIIVLPTGAGKTHVGMEIMKLLCLNTLIIVPTLDLMEQWCNNIQEFLFIEPSDSKQGNEKIDKHIGMFGGGKKEILPITIATYSSSYIHVARLRNHFGLVIFDEVHHLAGEKFSHVGEGMMAPYRLGLTATLNEKDEIYPVLESLIGKIVHREFPRDLAAKQHLAPHKIIKIKVELNEDKLREYEEYKTVYSTFMQKLSRRGNAFQQLIFLSNVDPEAREALDAFNKSRDVAFNAEEKLEHVASLLSQHLGDRIIIFSENIAFVELLSRKFLIPAITSHTPSREREIILNHFRTGKFRIIVTGKVLDEGVDVPEANVAIIISGTGTKRQFIQRLGRILRPKQGKTARLYEIVSDKTSEMRISSRRSHSW
ncbi:MAG: DEAD/DEAH box helicase [Promethearchaeota archaeon]